MQRDYDVQMVHSFNGRIDVPDTLFPGELLILGHCFVCMADRKLGGGYANQAIIRTPRGKTAS